MPQDCRQTRTAFIPDALCRIPYKKLAPTQLRFIINSILSQLLFFPQSSLLSSFPSRGDHSFRFWTGPKILARLFNYPAPNKIEYHDHCQPELELEKKRSNRFDTKHVSTHTESAISTICSHRFNSGIKSVAPENATALAPTRPQYKAEFSRIPSRKGRPLNGISHKITKSQSRKGTSLEIDCKCWDLLRQSKKIDGSVQQVRFKLGFEINRTTPSVIDSINRPDRPKSVIDLLLVCAREVSDIHQGHDMQSKL